MSGALAAELLAGVTQETPSKDKRRDMRRPLHERFWARVDRRSDSEIPRTANLLAL